MTTRWLTRKRQILFGAILLISAAAIFLTLRSGTDTAGGFLFGTVTRGSIETTISTSGTLSPVTQVEVGTQVSGTIDKILVDFNDRVYKGQVIAILDTSVLVLAVSEAQSGFVRAEAQLEEAEANYKRNQDLFQKGMLSESEFHSSKTSQKTADASMMSARTTLERAKQNLRYAIIKAPISGTVTSRNIEAGQTVAASFSTPTLFTIAQDMSKMEIRAMVDESDIGEIKEGQSVRFTVQAYPKNTFPGRVRQVRISPVTSSNIVNYTVVISADNEKNLLLPGMTATVEFIVASKSNVLLVPNSALRFQPTEAMVASLAQPPMAPPDSLRSSNLQPPGPPPGEQTAAGGTADDRKRVWFVNEKQGLIMEPVLVGLTDGTNTEILMTRQLSEGMSIITGTKSATTATSKAKTSTGMQGGPPGGMPPPM